MSMAAQEKLKLVQFDVKGAFMVSGIEDQDIYVELPKGYGVPQGRCETRSQLVRTQMRKFQVSQDAFRLDD
eukprot:1722481-Rhodomonas_salina.3